MIKTLSLFALILSCSFSLLADTSLNDRVLSALLSSEEWFGTLRDITNQTAEGWMDLQLKSLQGDAKESLRSKLEPLAEESVAAMKTEVKFETSNFCSHSFKGSLEDVISYLNNKPQFERTHDEETFQEIYTALSNLFHVCKNAIPFIVQRKQIDLRRGYSDSVWSS